MPEALGLSYLELVCQETRSARKDCAKSGDNFCLFPKVELGPFFSCLN